jgi:YVTN family beta-propeller protein
MEILMRFRAALVVILSLWFGGVPVSGADQPIKRLLYVTSRDGAGGKGGKGIYVYDIDNGHKLVRFIEMPQLGGTRGACACAATDRMWIAHGNDKLLCLDLKTDKVLWEIRHSKEEGGFDRVGVTPDGSKVYAPSGWWNSNPDVKVIDGETGKVLKRIPVAPKGGLHNLIVTPDGRHVVVGSTQYNMLSVIDTTTDTVTLRVGPIIGVIQPLTINGAGTLAYINTHLYREGHGPGFEIGDLKTGKILHIVGRPELKERKTRCHGIGLTPDEKEAWLVDQGSKELHIFDNTVMPPRFKQTVPMAARTHGWICFSRDGKYAWCDTGEVFDTATKKRIAQWTDKPDGQGNPVMSSKFFEVHFKGKDAVWVGHQMGIGYKKESSGLK